MKDCKSLRTCAERSQRPLFTELFLFSDTCHLPFRALETGSLEISYKTSQDGSGVGKRKEFRF